jgi:hypothetical protein
MRHLLAVAILVLASACASKETRVRGALLKAGLPPPAADCMAEQMADRLSIAQLRRLQRIGALRGERLEELTVGEFVERARALNDREMLGHLSVASVGCALVTRP